MVTTPTLRKVMAVVDEDAATELAKLANTPILTAAVTSQIGKVCLDYGGFKMEGGCDVGGFRGRLKTMERYLVWHR